MYLYTPPTARNIMQKVRVCVFLAVLRQSERILQRQYRTPPASAVIVVFCAVAN